MCMRGKDLQLGFRTDPNNVCKVLISAEVVCEAKACFHYTSRLAHTHLVLERKTQVCIVELDNKTETTHLKNANRNSFLYHFLLKTSATTTS